MAAWAPLILGVVGWTSAQAAVADDPAGPQIIPSVPARSEPGGRMTADDGFLPLTKVVPRAKIVLREKERLPDLGGTKTFAAYGARRAEPAWYAGEAIVPMYVFAHQPIYFEDMNLERCGLSCGCCLQPAVSGLHFFGSVALLPYKLLVSPPCSCVYPPGECGPGCHFSCCENFIGPQPDFSKLFCCGILKRAPREIEQQDD
jgi:hypothetical protein